MENKRLQVFWDVNDSTFREVNMFAVLEVNGSQIFYENTEYLPAGTHDRDVAARSIKWASLTANEMSIEVEYGNSLDSTIDSVLNLNDLKLSKIEDKDNAAWKRSVLTEVYQSNLDRAGIIS